MTVAPRVSNLPDAVKTANRLLLEIETQVQRFPKLHKFRTGQRLVDEAFTIADLAYEIWFDRDKRGRIEDLDTAIRRFKITLQLASKLNAFTSIGALENVATLARSLGKQCGGWRKKLQGQGPAASAPAGSASILSSRPASLAEAQR